MMSSATAQRAGRAPKDKNKTQPSHSTTKTPSETSKATEGMVSKIQPTAEQLRIAQIINDANKGDYPDLKDKVERIIEITGKTSDAALVALHDCDNDSNRAAIMLLEGNQDEGKWETSGKKKKNRQSQQKTPEVNGHEPAPVEKEEKEPVENTNKKREPKQREGGYRYRGPPRMNRGNQGGRNWRNKENEKNERNLQEGQGRRERNTEGRSRGPRKNFSSGRGRGRGGRSRTFQNRGLQNNDGFPESIDTWQNSTAEKVNMSNPADATMTVGNWSDVAVTEEWSEEDWTENLTETKVFTPSAGTQQSSAVAGLDIPAASAIGQNIDLTSFLQKSSTNPETASNSLSGNNVTQPGQSSLMTQQIPQMPQNVAPQSQSNFDFTQFAKQAADQIKAAVGVVTQPTPSAPPVNANSFQSNNASYQSTYNMNSNSSSQHHVQIPHELQQVIVSQSSYTSGSQPSVHMSRELHSPVASQQSSSAPTVKTTTTSQQHQAPLPQRVKQPPKARLPPPSKIPESAVVMPDDAVTSLDVQFGALQFGTDSSPFDFTAGGESNNSYQDLGQNSNGSSHVNSQALPSNITSQSYSNPLPSPVTMNKDSTYNMGSHSSPSQNSISSDLNQSQKVASQDSMLLSQSEHKNVDNVSSYMNHRTNQSSNLDGSMMSSKADQSAMNSFNTSSHESASAYSYGNQKSVLNSSNLVPSSVSYTHTSASLNSGSSDLSNNQASQPKYQAQVANQNQNTSYATSASSYGLQSSAYSGSVTTSGSTYPSQTGYSSHASASYGSSNTGYNNQQGVYSGSVTTTTQSGSMISTTVSSSKLTNSLSHGVKESSLLESQHSSSQHTYEVASTTSSSSVLSASSLAPTSSVNHSVQNSSNMNSVLGLVSTSSSTTTTSVLKNSLSATGKAVPNIPQNMPAMLGHQYIMGQASLPFYGLQQPVYSYEDMQMLQSKMSTLGLQSPVYSYEDMQMIQSKLSTLGYYDMQFQAPTSMTGRDPGMGSVAYTTDGKYSRAETDASTVATTLSQGQANTQAHGQAFLNPALPPGYGYYFAGGMMTGGIHHYAPPIFPVPPATNTHGATTNTQFQKANAYGSHSYNSGYESLTQAQDYTKGTYGAASQNQVKGVSGSGAVPDLSGSVYSKTHAQLAKYNDKPGFHTGTPPPFNLAGSQAAGPLGASSGPYATQFIPVLAHGQHHSTLLHHHMQQDTSQTGGTPTAGQRVPQGLGQPKNSSKQNYAYWTSN